jgi:hypothetical protein
MGSYHIVSARVPPELLKHLKITARFAKKKNPSILCSSPENRYQTQTASSSYAPKD